MIAPELVDARKTFQDILRRYNIPFEEKEGLSYVLPVEQVMKAPDYFEKHHQLPQFITWHDDAFL